MFRTDVENIPYDIHIIALFEGNIIHSVVKTKEAWFQYRGMPYEKFGFNEEYKPYGVSATCGEEAYVSGIPVGWCFPKDIFREEC